MEQGYRLLGASTEVVPDLLYTVTAARRSWAEANKDAVTRYVRALAAAFDFIRDGGEPRARRAHRHAERGRLRGDRGADA